MTLQKLFTLLVGSAMVAGLASPSYADATQPQWSHWRGPLQNGVSLETYKNSKVGETPSWTYATRGRGAPVVYEGRVFSWGYRGAGEDLVEVLTCLDAKTGKKLWEHEHKDFNSDTVYDRYSIGAPSVDPETKQVYLITHYGILVCYDFDGKELWKISMAEDFGRLSFPNSRVGSVSIEGELAIVHGIFSNWGADGPAADRFYAFDKNTGELVWWSTPGITPPVDSSFSTPVFETRYGQRVFYAGTGCGNIVAVNARSGKPLFRFQASKNGINSSVVVVNDKIVTIHNDENTDSSEKGRMAAIHLPKELGQPAEGENTVVLPPSQEAWRNPLAATSSSPVHDGKLLYQLTDGGELNAVSIETGEVVWKIKLSNGNLHSSLQMVDGLLYCPLMEGKLFVVKPYADRGEVVQTLKLEGQCLGAPAIYKGQLFVHTTEKLYAFPILHDGLAEAKAPEVSMPPVGKPAALQIIPAEVIMTPNDTQTFRVRSVDANGFPISEVKDVKWESYVPPTARVKAKMDASFNDKGEMVTTAAAKLSAGAFKATSKEGISGTVRGRVLQNLPIQMNFNEFALDQDQAKENVKFSYPPLPWIGARFKFDVREFEGEKVFAKTFDRVLFQRATTFVGKSDLSDYTMQADVLTEGSARVKSDMGFVHQRYLIVLRGNGNKLEVSSNLERLQKSVPFRVIANKWYTLKSRVDKNSDGTGVVKAKVWERGTPEPEAWSIEVPVHLVHQNGSPGIFSFTPLNQRRAYLDNLSIISNK